MNKTVIAWILDFLTARPQYVKLDSGNGEIKSKTLMCSTGAPQGAVLSPFLFTIYTNSCKLSNKKDLHLIKFADDTSLQGMIHEDESSYRDAVIEFTSWCRDNFLILNVKKTKELIIDFRKNSAPKTQLQIEGEDVEIVTSYKYLGVTIDHKLTWNNHAEKLVKNIHSRIYFLRKLNSFKVDHTMLSLFYKATIQSVITFAIVCWGGNGNVEKKNRINSLINKAKKICKANDIFADFEMLHLLESQKKIMSIVKDKNHPLMSQIKFSVRSGKPVLVKTKCERYRKSFLPYAMKLL